MHELEHILVGKGVAASAASILEGVTDELAHRSFPGAPQSIYGELWHTAFWQQVTLDWIHGRETPPPEHASGGFPSEEHRWSESWSTLCQRFLAGAHEAALLSRDAYKLDQPVRCPSVNGFRITSAGEQLISLAAHNEYHLGRIVLLRQLGGAWPPPSGGFTW